MNLPAIYDKASNWYVDWYLELRLEEELARAARYDLSLSLIILLQRDAIRSKQDSVLIGELLSDIAARKLRRTDIPAILGTGEYAVLLPHTDTRQAEVVAKRLVKWFAPFSVAVGIASYPEETIDAPLLATAGERALADLKSAASLVSRGRSDRSAHS